MGFDTAMKGSATTHRQKNLTANHLQIIRFSKRTILVCVASATFRYFFEKTTPHPPHYAKSPLFDARSQSVGVLKIMNIKYLHDMTARRPVVIVVIRDPGKRRILEGKLAILFDFEAKR
jgi:hypothetical protein